MFALALRLIEHETEQEAFDQLYTRYRGLAFWVAKGYHLSDSDAEDAVQDAFFALAEIRLGRKFFQIFFAKVSQLEVSHRYYSEEQSHRHLAAEPAPGGGDL